MSLTIRPTYNHRIVHLVFVGYRCAYLVSRELGSFVIFHLALMNVSQPLTALWLGSVCPGMSYETKI